jgi:hypothetical protein
MCQTLLNHLAKYWVRPNDRDSDAMLVALFNRDVAKVTRLAQAGYNPFRYGVEVFEECPDLWQAAVHFIPRIVSSKVDTFPEDETCLYVPAPTCGTTTVQFSLFTTTESGAECGSEAASADNAANAANAAPTSTEGASATAAAGESTAAAKPEAAAPPAPGSSSNFLDEFCKLSDFLNTSLSDKAQKSQEALKTKLADTLDSSIRRVMSQVTRENVPQRQNEEGSFSKKAQKVPAGCPTGFREFPAGFSWNVEPTVEEYNPITSDDILAMQQARQAAEDRVAEDIIRRRCGPGFVSGSGSGSTSGFDSGSGAGAGAGSGSGFGSGNEDVEWKPPVLSDFTSCTQPTPLFSGRSAPGFPNSSSQRSGSFRQPFQGSLIREYPTATTFAHSILSRDDSGAHVGAAAPTFSDGPSTTTTNTTSTSNAAASSSSVGSGSGSGSGSNTGATAPRLAPTPISVVNEGFC